jgi:hypothetical protein
LKGFNQRLDSTGADYGIAVEQKYKFAGARIYANVIAGGEASVVSRFYYANSLPLAVLDSLLHYFKRPIIRCIIDHCNLIIES